MELEKLRENLKTLGSRVEKLAPSITNEEQTKNAFIMPFFQTLGYDVFNPLEFVPEFTADVGIKKGEKVDYAMVIDGEPQLLIECKSINEKLTNHDSQLFRYFGTTTSKFGILTNGREYRFYTDLDEKNKMDKTPFLTIDVTKFKDNQFLEIAKFHKENFDISKITSSASELKYLNNLKEFLTNNIEEPSESFTTYLVSQIYDGRKTKNTIEEFTPIIKKGFNQFITERVNEKLSAALNTNVEPKTSQPEEIEVTNEQGDGIITTPEELEAFTVFKVTVNDLIDVNRLFYRDTKSYFGILIDDNSRKWIFRFYQKATKNLIEIRDQGTYEIDNPLDIANYKDKIKVAIENFR
ncbi:type I restriction endonuclease [Lactococcus petauri]|nr:MULTISPECIES: type I restriction endonuclease [Lactococcus]MBS4464418.1 type I restriction enzyme HsdR N-terminal domain-containing protein [Lactococcus garvieae]QQC58105.1 type I restriction enzyme HsdR N-terminal domain-containing protein [Lactococcus garvieae]USI71037.1 type I restriction enzyme HsdR N-terminal domain-containing protein [Lactococcus garvieae subsp. garvieae]